MWPPAGGAASAEDLAEGGSKSGLVFGDEGAELSDDETLFESGDDRLDGRGLEQAGALPVAQPDLAPGGRGAQLAGDGHQHQVGPFEAVGAAGNDDELR